MARTELSDRETEVLRLIANGKDNAEIAQDLHISPKTVKNHISNILMKLPDRQPHPGGGLRGPSGLV